MNAVAWPRWLRIMLRRKARHMERAPLQLFVWLLGGICGAFLLCIIFAGDNETAYTAFGSLFSALAFAGVIVTVLLQRAELREQRKELRAQRRELEGQKRELEIQNRTAQLQRFENSFFHLLDGFKHTLDELREEDKSRSASPSCFDDFHREIDDRMRFYKRFGVAGTRHDIQFCLTHLPTIYKKFFYEYYLIINFICNHEAFMYDKSKICEYISIVNIALNNSEYFLLFYDGIAHVERAQLINKYALLAKYSLLNSSKTPCSPWHTLFYAQSAFGADYEEYVRKHQLKGKCLSDFLPDVLASVRQG